MIRLTTWKLRTKRSFTYGPLEALTCEKRLVRGARAILLNLPEIT